MIKTILKQGLLGAAMIVAMLGISTAAQAYDDVFCVAVATGSGLPTIGTVFKTKYSSAYTACSDCDVKWSDYIRRHDHDHWSQYSNTTRGSYNSSEKADDVLNEYNDDALDRDVDFHYASGFSCSGN